MPDNHNSYNSIEEAIIDMMANTDCPYHVANSFAPLIYQDGWSGWTYDNGETARSIHFIPPSGDYTIKVSYIPNSEAFNTYRMHNGGLDIDDFDS